MNLKQVVGCLTIFVVGYIWSGALAKGQSVAPQGRVYFDVEGLSPQSSGLVRVPIDNWNYLKVPSDLSVLRVTDADFNERPYILRLQPVNSLKSEQLVWTIPSWSKKELADGDLSFVFALSSDDPSPIAMTIEPARHNFEKRVKVYGIGEGKEESLIGDSFVYDYLELNRTADLTVSLKQNESRVFRVLVSEPLDTDPMVLAQEKDRTPDEERSDFDIEEFVLAYSPLKAGPAQVGRVPYDVAIRRRRNNPEDNTTYIHLQTSGQPISRLTIVTQNQSFSRKVNLSAAEGDSETLVPIGDYSISSFSSESHQAAQLSLDFDLRRTRDYLLAIEYGEQLPLEVSKVVAYGHRHEFVFLKASTDDDLHIQVHGPHQREHIGEVNDIESAMEGSNTILEGRLSLGLREHGFPQTPDTLRDRLIKVWRFICFIAPLFFFTVPGLLIAYFLRRFLWTRKRPR